MNILIISGRIGQDPEAKQTPAGQVVTFSLAETVFINGEKSTAWHDCQAWGKPGENILKYAQKGTGVTVQGSLMYNEYESKDGHKVKRAKINVHTVEITSNWKNNSSQQGKAPQVEQEYDDGLPF
jgi:single stranded DNA-binding protein